MPSPALTLGPLGPALLLCVHERAGSRGTSTTAAHLEKQVSKDVNPGEA